MNLKKLYLLLCVLTGCTNTVATDNSYTTARVEAWQPAIQQHIPASETRAHEVETDSACTTIREKMRRNKCLCCVVSVFVAAYLAAAGLMIRSGLSQ